MQGRPCLRCNLFICRRSVSAHQACIVSSRVDSDKRDHPSQGASLPHTVQPQPGTVRMLTEDPLSSVRCFSTFPSSQWVPGVTAPGRRWLPARNSICAAFSMGNLNTSTQIRLLPCPASWPQASLWVNFNRWYSEGKEVERKEERDGSPSLSCDFCILHPPLSHTHTVTSHYTAFLCSHTWPLHRSGRARIPP